jgi:cell division protein FtsB
MKFQNRTALLKWQGKDAIILSVKFETGEFQQIRIDLTPGFPVIEGITKIISDASKISDDELKFRFLADMSKHSWLTFDDFETYSNIYRAIEADKEAQHTKEVEMSEIKAKLSAKRKRISTLSDEHPVVAIKGRDKVNLMKEEKVNE